MTPGAAAKATRSSCGTAGMGDLEMRQAIVGSTKGVLEQI
jgi:hypothetical protein